MLDDPSRTTAIGMARYAAEFIEGALTLDDSMGAKKGYEVVAPIPVLFLIGQGIELAFKSYLLHCGEQLQAMRGYGHSLHKAHRKAKELGLGQLVVASAEESCALDRLDALYVSKQLQYIRTGSKVFPSLSPLRSFALRLVHAVGAKVGYTPRDLPPH